MVLAAALLLVSLAHVFATPRAAADDLMCGWQVEPRPQTVSIDPDLSAAGLTHADVFVAFDRWNRLFERYHGFPIFVPHHGEW